MPTALTPHELIADLRALDRIETDWSAEGRLDGLTKDSLDDKRYELMDSLRERFTTVENDGPFRDWSAWQGDMDCDLVDAARYVPTIPVAYGKTELEAIEQLLEMIGEDA